MMESTMSEELIDTLSPIESLPTEILQMIFGYLSAEERIGAERVCKRWREISTTGGVWKDVKILRVSEQDDTDYMQIAFISKIVEIPSRANHEEIIESIAVRPKELFINFDKSRIIQSLFSRIGQNVKELILDMRLFNETSRTILSIITTYCHNIEDIHLDDWNVGIYPRVSDSGALLWLLQVNDQLQSIMSSSGEKIVEILPLKNWKSLHFGGVHSVTKEWEKKMIALIKNSPSLENLTLPFCTTNILVAISEYNQLTNLTLVRWFPKPVQNNRMIEVPLMDNLKVLELTFDSEGRENNSIAFINSSPSLQTLKIHALTTNILAAISRCKQLESLVFTEWCRVPVKNDLVIEIPSLNNLKLLKWTNADFQKADGEFIDLLHHHCMNLEGLCLHASSSLYDQRIFPLEVEQAILSLSKLNSLELLGLPITDEKLSRFGKFKYLHFNWISHCTEDGIFEMIMNSECLEELHCPGRITLKLLKRLVKNTRERRKIFKIAVDPISKEKLKICKNSKIHLIPEKFLY